MLSLLMPRSFPRHSGLIIYLRLVMPQKTDEAGIYSKGTSSVVFVWFVIDCEWNFNLPGFYNLEFTCENSQCWFWSQDYSFLLAFLRFLVLSSAVDSPTPCHCFRSVTSLPFPVFYESSIILIKTNFYHYRRKHPTERTGFC